MVRITGRRVTVALAAAMLATALAPPAAGQTYGRRRYEIEREISSLKSSLPDLEYNIKTWKKDLVPAQKAEADAEGVYSQAKAQSQDARRALDESRRNVGEANTNKQATLKRVTDRLEAAPEFVAARKAMEAARQDADQHRERVLAAERGKPAYRQAATAIKETRDRLATLRASGTADPVDMAREAESLLQRESALAKIEQAILQADPQWAKADAKLNEVTAAYQTQRKQVDAAAAQDPERLAAIKAHEDATANLKAVSVSLDAALRNLAVKESAYGQARGYALRLTNTIANAEREIIRRQDRIGKLSEELSRLPRTY